MQEQDVANPLCIDRKSEFSAGMAESSNNNNNNKKRAAVQKGND